MISFLHRLKKIGFIPNKVLDIGSEKGSWTESSLKIFNSCTYTLIEPIGYSE